MNTKYHGLHNSCLACLQNHFFINEAAPLPPCICFTRCLHWCIIDIQCKNKELCIVFEMGALGGPGNCSIFELFTLVYSLVGWLWMWQGSVFVLIVDISDSTVRSIDSMCPIYVCPPPGPRTL